MPATLPGVVKAVGEAIKATAAEAAKMEAPPPKQPPKPASQPAVQEDKEVKNGEAAAAKSNPTKTVEKMPTIKEPVKGGTP